MYKTTQARGNYISPNTINKSQDSHDELLVTLDLGLDLEAIKLEFHNFVDLDNFLRSKLNCTPLPTLASILDDVIPTFYILLHNNLSSHHLSQTPGP